MAKLKEVNLIDALGAGVGHIYAGLDRRRGCRPYFGWDPIGGSASHSFADTPHVVGRFLDVLGLCAGIFDMPVDEQAVKGLTKLMAQSLARGAGFAWSDVPWGKQIKGIAAAMHDQREALLALVALMTWRRSRRAAQLAQRLVDRIERTTRKTGNYPGRVLTRSGWLPEPQGPDFDSTTTIGRLVGALVKYYRASGNSTALVAARRFADYQLEHCFDADGHVLEPAGTHLHSICGTCSGLIDLGILEHDHSYVEAGRKIYDVGLRPYRTSYGWVKESRSGQHGRGEPNNTADVVEAALYLGQAGHPAYFEDAEVMVRNLLLRCQIHRTDWVGDGGGKEDTSETMYKGVRQKIRGAFYFPTPNDFNSYNTDLTGAVMQGLCEAWHATTRHTDGRVWVDMLFTRRDESAHVRSRLPESGRVQIDLKRAAGLAVRIAPWIDRARLKATLNGRPAKGRFGGHYLVFDGLPRGAKVKLTFPQPVRRSAERAAGWPHTYRLKWIGNTVESIRPKGKICPLFEE